MRGPRHGSSNGVAQAAAGVELQDNPGTAGESMLAGTTANPPVHFSKTSTATWNLNMVKRWAVLFISAIPYYFYAYFPTTAFNPTFAAGLGIPPTLVLGWQCYYKWGALSAGTSFKVFKPPPLFWKDFDSFVMRAFKDLNPRWLWVYWVYTPIIALVTATLGSFYIDGVDGDPDQHGAGPTCYTGLFSTCMMQTVMIGGISWAGSSLILSLGAMSNVSKYQEAKWVDAKAKFATTHDAHNLAETFERIAMESATQQTNRTSMKCAVVLLSLMPACAAAYRVYYYAGAIWPGAITSAVAFLTTFSVFMCFWGFFQWMLIILMQEYLTLSNIAKSLSDCTQAWEASITGLPHIPLITAADIWKWYDLRQIFVTIRFDHCYAICGTSMTAMSAFSLLLLLFSVLKMVVLDLPLFDAENFFGSLVSFEAIASVLVLLTRITNIYTQQQKHVHILEEAHFQAMHSATRNEAGSALSNAPDTAGGLLEAIKKHIKDENYCPHVLGISVKPTFFYFVLAYVATALGAIAVKNVARMLD
jgi:hypothetical protein